MTTPVILTGFEYGVADPNANGGGLFSFVASPSPNVQIISSDKNTGVYCLQLEADGTNDAYVRWTLATPAIVVARQYIKIVTEPATAQIILQTFCTTSAASPRIYVNPATHVFELRAGATVIATGPSYSTGIWYRIDWKADVSANPWNLYARIDGGTEFSGTSAQAADTIINYTIGTTSTAAQKYLHDDVVISLTSGDYPIGAGGTELIIPTSDGTHNAGVNVIEDNAGTDIGTTTAYDKINSVPFSSATYIRQAANGTGNYAEVLFGDLVANVSSIIGANVVLAYTSETTSANNGGCIVSTDSFSTHTAVWGESGTLKDYSDGSTSNLFYKNVVITGLNTSLVNAFKARMGYSSDASPDPYWIDLVIEVGYVPSSISIPVLYHQLQQQGIG